MQNDNNNSNNNIGRKKTYSGEQTIHDSMPPTIKSHIPVIQNITRPETNPKNNQNQG